uniref:Uncharacterized protein n=1 Tax=Ciona intestinalis TaxID=7719 RepID=H2Y3C7_CIOIN
MYSKHNFVLHLANTYGWPPLIYHVARSVQQIFPEVPLRFLPRASCKHRSYNNVLMEHYKNTM